MQVVKTTVFTGKKVNSIRSARTAAPARKPALNVVARNAPWAPGSIAPDYLDGSLPGDYGFDPLRLSADPSTFARARECEILHARWCMLALPGMLAPELVGQGNWLEAPNWVFTGEVPTWNGISMDLGVNNVGLLIGVEFLLMGAAELYRQEETDAETRCYPGGNFDPLKLAANADTEGLQKLKAKEIANGRLAMLAVLGCWAQANVTGVGPIANWQGVFGTW